MWGLGAALYLAMWAFIPREPAGEGDSTAPEPTRSWLAFSLLLGVVVIGLIFVSLVAGLPRFGGGLLVVWIVFLAGVSIVSIRVSSPRLTFQRFAALVVLAFLTIVIVLAGGFLAFLSANNISLSGGDGQRNWQPTTLTAVAHNYQTEFGEATVNLASVVFPTRGYDVSVSVAAGELVLFVPMDAVVDLRTHVAIGSVSYNTDGVPDGFDPLPRGAATAAERDAAPHLTVTATVGVGTILVERQAPASSRT